MKKVLPLVLVLALACDKPKPETTAPTATAAPVEVASITPRTAEKSETLIVGTRPAFALPAEDLPLPVPSEMTREGKRIAYKTGRGKNRVVYLVGASVFLGKVYDAVDWSKIPTFDEAVRDIYAKDGPREALFKAIKETKGDVGLGGFLADIADIPDQGEWWKGVDLLEAAGKGELTKRLAPVVTAPGKDTATLRRAVTVVDLHAQTGAIHARVEELLQKSPVPEPAAVGIMLRALVKDQPKEAAALGCTALKGMTKEGAAGNPLAAAAALAVLKGGGACPEAKIILDAEPCATAARCTDKGPISPLDTTTQEEPLCTKAQVEKAADADLARTPRDLLHDEYSPAVAFAIAILGDNTPPDFQKAQARRLYKITQPKTPECDGEVKDGTACHCSEPTLRSTACRSAGPKVVTSGCAFMMDDTKKTIDKVTASKAPVSQ
jgi:hypothetical protein